jgi:ketosteroid isomerase-like protein
MGLAALIAGCSGSATPTTSEDPEGVFRDFVAALNAGDAAAAAALVAEDAEFYGDRADDVGIDALLASLVCTAEVRSAELDGDTADLELEFTGQAPLAEAGSECAEGTSETARVTVRDGKILRITEVP